MNLTMMYAILKAWQVYMFQLKRAHIENASVCQRSSQFKYWKCAIIGIISAKLNGSAERIRWQCV